MLDFILLVFRGCSQEGKSTFPSFGLFNERSFGFIRYIGSITLTIFGAPSSTYILEKSSDFPLSRYITFTFMAAKLEINRCWPSQT